MSKIILICLDEEIVATDFTETHTYFRRVIYIQILNTAGCLHLPQAVYPLSKAVYTYPKLFTLYRRLFTLTRTPPQKFDAQPMRHQKQAPN